jgi:hypothetical protein
MPASGRLSTVAALVFVLLLAGYVYVGLNLRQSYEAERALSDALARSGPVWQAVRSQPLEEPAPVQAQISAAAARVAKQQALFPRQPDVIAVLDNFLALARVHSIQVLRMDAQPAAPQKTKAGTYGVIRYAVQAQGSWLKMAPFLRKLAEQGEFAAMGLENLAVTVGDADRDDIRFDLVIYVRAV